MSIFDSSPKVIIHNGLEDVYIKDRIMEDSEIIDKINSLPNYSNNIQIYNTYRDAYLKELINGNHILQIYEDAKQAYKEAESALDLKAKQIIKLRHNYFIKYYATGITNQEIKTKEATIKSDEKKNEETVKKAIKAREAWGKTEEERLFSPTQQAQQAQQGQSGTEAEEPPSTEGTGGSRTRRSRRSRRTRRTRRSIKTKRTRI